MSLRNIKNSAKGPLTINGFFIVRHSISEIHQENRVSFSVIKEHLSSSGNNFIVNSVNHSKDSSFRGVCGSGLHLNGTISASDCFSLESGHKVISSFQRGRNVEAESSIFLNIRFIDLNDEGLITDHIAQSEFMEIVKGSHVRFRESNSVHI